MVVARAAFFLLCIAAVGTAAIEVPQWNDTKCPAFWELQRPGMEHFSIDELPGYYYELAFHDVTQYPLCMSKSKCITSEKAIQTHADGVKYVNDTWDLQCFGHPYPQTLLFNITDQPGYLRGYVPATAIPFLPKNIVANTIFPDTVVDFKSGPEGWALEFQCVEWKGSVRFIGINYYSKLKTEEAFQEMDKAARARGLGFYMDKGFGLRRVDHSDCPLEPEKEVAESSAAEKPCCQGKCLAAGKEKYYSLAKSLFGTLHCGECCMDPSKYNEFHFFEKNLTKATSDSPCKDFGYTEYDSTATHGFGPVSMTLDLYDIPKRPIVI